MNIYLVEDTSNVPLKMDNTVKLSSWADTLASWGNERMYMRAKVSVSDLFMLMC